MKRQHATKSRFVRVLGNLALLLFSLVIALGFMELLLRSFPNLVPAAVRVNPPVRRVKALIDETYDLRQSDGDLYYLMRGNIAPLSPDQDKIVAQVHMTTDANGFRNSPPEKAAYEMVALGDSFTRASGVAAPWTQKLAEYTGNDVLNLGDVGFGPQDELKVLRQYGLKKQPQWVILAYFEGNDLYDVAAYEQANPFILARFGRFMIGRGLEAWQQGRAGKAGEASEANIPSYRYPIRMTIDNNDLEITFFSPYISWLSLSRKAIASSQNFRMVKENILKMRELSDAADAQFLLVYVPSKSHIYLPFLKDPETIASVFSDVPIIELDDSGFLQFRDKKATPELVNQHIDDQAYLLADFSAEQQINFLDLTSTFQEEASTGAELYYPFDTHWNQRGHDLAAQTIARHIEDILNVTAGTKPGQR